jgi:tRNA A-37 threonylcarbamoyl transferase component Bud32
MRTFVHGGISWALEDEGTLPFVDGLTVGTGPRRTHQSLVRGDRRVFVKYFVEKGLTGFARNIMCPRGRKEYLLGKRLSSLGIDTPRPLGYGRAKSGSFILQEHLNGIPLKAALEGEPARQQLLDGLSVLLKQLREHRISHNDLHLENVLVSGGRLYLIDLHKTVIRRWRFSRSDELRNLTHALTMIYDTMPGDERSRFFDLYGHPRIRDRVEDGLLSLWRSWIRNKKKRAFSTTSKLVAEEKRICVRDALGNGDGPLQKVFKKDRKVTVEAHDDHIRKIYRDRRRLKRAWISHVVLEYLEMEVGPHPFYLQKASFFHPGYIAMEDLRGKGVELDRFLDREYDGMDSSRRNRFFRSLSDFVDGILRRGVFHKDLKACNLFALSDGRFRLLDIEDVQFCHPGHEEIKRMLVQLNTSVPRRIGLTARMRFFARVTRGILLDRRKLLHEVVEASMSEKIVYEGVAGLRREEW